MGPKWLAVFSRNRYRIDVASHETVSSFSIYLVFAYIQSNHLATATIIDNVSVGVAIGRQYARRSETPPMPIVEILQL